MLVEYVSLDAELWADLELAVERVEWEEVLFLRPRCEEGILMTDDEEGDGTVRMLMGGGRNAIQNT